MHEIVSDRHCYMVVVFRRFFMALWVDTAWTSLEIQRKLNICFFSSFFRYEHHGLKYETDVT